MEPIIFKQLQLPINFSDFTSVYSTSFLITALEKNFHNILSFFNISIQTQLYVRARYLLTVGQGSPKKLVLAYNKHAFLWLHWRETTFHENGDLQ